MRFMLIQSYGRAAGVDIPGADIPITEWSHDDVVAHIEFQRVLNDELGALGELIDAQALSGPEVASSVTWDGSGVPVVTDGPFPESKELIAGYRIVEVESRVRAVEIAARISAAPGPGGVPIRQPIEVRQVLDASAADL